jgi:hypothetical protein
LFAWREFSLVVGAIMSPTGNARNAGTSRHRGATSLLRRGRSNLREAQMRLVRWLTFARMVHKQAVLILESCYP